jgi:acetyl-CoA acetyltransferase
MTLPPVVVVGASRTPFGARNGVLAGWHAADLVAEVLAALARRIGLDPTTVDEVLVGCASPVGDQGANVGRNAVLAAGWPESVPATTLDAQGVSSLRAIALAADSIGSGSAEVVVAAGVEVSSTTPAGAWVSAARQPFGPGVVGRYAGAGGLVPPGVAAEALAERRGLSRVELDAWATESRRRARATAAQVARAGAGRAGAGSARATTEIAAVAARGWDRERRQARTGDHEVVVMVEDDELVAGGPTGAQQAATEPAGEDPATRRPMFVPGGRITAYNSAPPADAAAAVVLMGEERSRRLGLHPLARIVATATGGVDPVTMLTGAVPASLTALHRAGLEVADVDRFEVDECFAAVTLDWMAEVGVGPERVNVDGGAIARGLAPGAAGAAVVTTLVHALSSRRGRYGLATLGGVGGIGAAVVVQGAETEAGADG